MFPGHVMGGRQHLRQWRPPQDQTATVWGDDGERQIGTPTCDQLELVRATGTDDLVIEPRTDPRGVDAFHGRTPYWCLARPAYADHLGPTDRGDLDDVTSGRRVDHRAAADVDGDVTDRRLVEDQVAGLDLVLGDVRDRPVLSTRLMRQVHPGLSPCILRQ